MMRTIEGFYQNGQVQLDELPQEMGDRTQVLVTFLKTGKVDLKKLRQLIENLHNSN
jgi:hypothetical protein